MKGRKGILLALFCGAALGALGLGLAFWMDGFLGILERAEDRAFFLGLLLLVAGLFAWMKGGPASAAVASPSNAVAQSAFAAEVAMQEYEMQEKSPGKKRRRSFEFNKPGLALILAGVIDIAGGILITKL